MRYAYGHTEVWGGTNSGSLPAFLSLPPTSRPTPTLKSCPLSPPNPCPRRPSAALGRCPPPFTCSLAPGPRASGRRPGRQRALLVQKCGAAGAGRG